MTYISWIIALVVMGMVLAPILHIIPTRQQKNQTAFRQAALGRGLLIEVRQPKLPPALASQYGNIGRCVGYGKHAHNTLNNSYIALKSNNDRQWFWLNDQRPPAAMMGKMLAVYQDLPDFCLAVEQGPTGTTLFLVDNLGLDRLDLLEATLDKLNTLISQ